MSVCAACLPGFVSDHNLVEDRFTTDDGNSVLTLAEWQTLTSQDSNSVVLSSAAALDALFVDSSGGDFRLVDGLAVDAGEELAQVPSDLDGVARPQGLGWDAGCYEGVGVVFSDGFESGDTSSWSVTVP